MEVLQSPGTQKAMSLLLFWKLTKIISGKMLQKEKTLVITTVLTCFFFTFWEIYLLMFSGLCFVFYLCLWHVCFYLTYLHPESSA